MSSIKDSVSVRLLRLKVCRKFSSGSVPLLCSG